MVSACMGIPCCSLNVPNSVLKYGNWKYYVNQTDLFNDSEAVCIQLNVQLQTHTHVCVPLCVSLCVCMTSGAFVVRK